jgi:hypothetical protein|tara:strand:+ start:6331 stop:6630 length:300 start_codon:yes stop_codon:yes gene_type:complete
MDIKKLHVLKTGLTEEDQEARREQAKQEEERNDKRRAVQALVKTRGWKIVEEDLLKDEKILLDKLARVPMFRFWSSEEIKAERKAIRRLFNRINSYLID